MTSIPYLSEAARQNTDLECSSFFVFHSSKLQEEKHLCLKPSRGTSQRPHGLSHIEEIEARFLATPSAVSDDDELQDTASNPDASNMTMNTETFSEIAQWSYYPNSMQVIVPSKI